MGQFRTAMNRVDDRLWMPNWLTAASDVVFRVALSLIFIIGGLGHFFAVDEMLERIAESPWHKQVLLIGDPAILLYLSGGVFVVFGLFLAAGILKRLSALTLFVTLVPITIAVHIAPGHVGPLLKNVAILGALFLVYSKREAPVD